MFWILCSDNRFLAFGLSQGLTMLYPWLFWNFLYRSGRLASMKSISCLSPAIAGVKDLDYNLICTWICSPSYANSLYMSYVFNMLSCIETPVLTIGEKINWSNCEPVVERNDNLNLRSSWKDIPNCWNCVFLWLILNLEIIDHDPISWICVVVCLQF